MMNIDEHSVPTSRHDAAAAVTTHDAAPNRRWYRLLRAPGSRARGATRVGCVMHRADVLRVAKRHLDDLRSDLDRLAARVQLPAPAVLAEVERDLIRRAAWISRSAEHHARQEQQRRVIVERLSGLAPDLAERFAKESTRFA